ncbi:hypothetical protein [Amycolatopsis sp. NPDC054798]
MDAFGYFPWSRFIAVVVLTSPGKEAKSNRFGGEGSTAASGGTSG